MALLEDYLYSEEFLFEGEQAEAYKKRKADERAAKEKSYKNYNDKRFGTKYIGDNRQIQTKSPGNKMTKQNPNDRWYHPKKRAAGKEEDKKNKEAADSKYYHTNEKGQKTSVSTKTFRKDGEPKSRDEVQYDLNRAYDAAHRNARRHPKSESAEIELYEGAIDLI